MSARAAELTAGFVGVPLSFAAIAFDSWIPLAALVVVLFVCVVAYGGVFDLDPIDWDGDECPCRYCQGHPYDPLTGGGAP